MGYKKVGIIEIIIKVKDARNLLVIICSVEIGLVIKVSIVPALYSSEKERMLIAGIRNKKINGESVKKVSIEA